MYTPLLARATIWQIAPWAPGTLFEDRTVADRVVPGFHAAKSHCAGMRVLDLACHGAARLAVITASSERPSCVGRLISTRSSHRIAPTENSWTLQRRSFAMLYTHVKRPSRDSHKPGDLCTAISTTTFQAVSALKLPFAK